MVNKLSIPAISCGLFVSFSSLIDWYLNAPLRNQPFTEQERLIYECFLEKPRRIIPPPDLVNDWWMVVLGAGSIFYLGFISAKVTMDIYQSRFITIHNYYLKIICLTGLIMAFCAGFIMFIGAYMFPIVWKLYISLATAMLTFLGTYLVLRSPSHLYLCWRNKKREPF